MAALVVDNASLEVRAYAGSADFTDAERFSHVDMVRAARSPGSTLKPFLYGLALDEGLIHSESLLADVPQSFGGYQPGNFQQSFHGPVSVSEALTKSLNVPAVEVLERLDPVRFVALLRRGGLKLEFAKGGEPNLAVILGGASTRLEQLVGAYTAFARQGLAGKPRYTPDAPIEEQRMLSAGAAFIIRDLLESGRPAGPGGGERRRHPPRHRLEDRHQLRLPGRLVGGRLRPLHHRRVGRPARRHPQPGLLRRQHRGAAAGGPLQRPRRRPASTRTPPPGVKQERICWPLGTRAAGLDDRLCHQSRLAWTLNDAAPPTFPDRLRGGEARYEIQTTADGQLRARPDCHPGPLDTRPMARWPAVLEPWLDDNLRRRALPPQWAASCAGQARPESGLKIVGASNGEILRRSAGGDAPLLHLQVRGHAVHGKAGGPGTEVVWLVNGRPSARQPAGKGFEQRLTEPGRYDITVLDDSGAYDRISLSVR
jgi:penicillin-binding protein 1C